jgi:hypothetical protein
MQTQLRAIRTFVAIGPCVRRDDVNGFEFQTTEKFPRRRSARVVLSSHPGKTEGAGKTGCALHPRSRVQNAHSKNAHEHTGSAETLRPSLRSGFTAYFALSPVTGLSCHRRSRGSHRKNLTPASGRQDHTTSPSTKSVARLATLSRPPHPAPTLMTMANAPLIGTGLP